MKLDLVLILLVALYISMYSVRAESMPEVILRSRILTATSLLKAKENIKTKFENITQKFAILNKTSSDRKSCIWKLCSKPLKKQRIEESQSSNINDAKLDEAYKQYLQEIYAVRAFLNRKGH